MMYAPPEIPSAAIREHTIIIPKKSRSLWNTMYSAVPVMSGTTG